MFMVQKVYESGFQDYKLGLAAAMSVVMFFILLGLTLLQFRYMREEE
jgi:ABC-type sugar transport system permease subunit